MRIDARAAGLSVGLLWGCGVMFLGWIAYFGWGVGLVGPLSSLYIGYAATFLGGVIGGIWGFFDGFIGGVLLGWLYNSCNPRETR